MAACAYQNQLWQHFFRVNGIELCIVYYEDLVANRAEEIQRVMSFVGVEGEVTLDISDAGITKQANSLNEQWAEMFNAPLRIRRRSMV